MGSADYTKQNLEGFSRVLTAAGVNEQAITKFCGVFIGTAPDHGLMIDHALPPHYPSLLSTNNLLDGHGSCSYIQKRAIAAALIFAGIRRNIMTADQLLSKARQGEAR